MNNDKPIITDTQWLTVLREIEDSKRNIWIDILLMFFYEPNHSANLKTISKHYSYGIETLNILLQNLGNFVVRTTNLKAEIPETELLFEVSDDKVYTLKPQLISAIRKFLIGRLINVYREPILRQGLDNDNSKELYKWKILSMNSRKTTPEILEILRKNNDMNFLSWRIKDCISKALKVFKKETINCFDILRNTDGHFYEKFHAFSDIGNQFLPQDLAKSLLKENVASVFLSFVSPTDFVVYRFTVYKLISKYLGYTIDNTRPYEGYIKILNSIAEIEKSDEALIAKLKEETEKYFWNPLLNAQDVVWQTQHYIEKSYPKNWLQKVYDKGLKENHWVFQNWLTNYTKSVTTFLDMFADGKSASDIDDTTKDLFLRVKDNSISSNGQGMYTYEEYDRLLEHWEEIYNILKKNVVGDEISIDDYKELNEIIEPLLKKRRPSAYHRIWAGVFPDKLCTIIEPNAFNNTYEKIRHIDDSLPPLKNTWVESNMVLMDYFKDKVMFQEEYHRPIFAWYLKENLNLNEIDANMNKYIELLKANRNLVLTGAPGTGKTYLAKKIAEALGDSNPGFVQFHPSLDYSDFVEGLRPNNDTNSFERTDGIFKKFCKEAMAGVKFSDFDKAYESLVAKLLDLPEDDNIIKIKTPKSGAEFGISINSKLNLNLHTGKNLSQQGVLKRDDMKRMFSGEKVYDYWKGYYEGVILYLREQYNLKEAESNLFSSPDKANSNKKVFIIDEINRGELSKIFGELFFSIEPSYRGEKHKVFTQYQNLVPPGDPFENGFYVPENVYIIGTMNDIDRGVESMDFAIRRRFGWVEVKPQDRKEMLEETIPEFSEVASKLMQTLNDLITSNEIGLPSAYEIGPAYFLKLRDYQGDYEKLWNYNLQGLLFEYLRGDRNIENKMKILKESYFKSLEE